MRNYIKLRSEEKMTNRPKDLSLNDILNIAIKNGASIIKSKDLPHGDHVIGDKCGVGYVDANGCFHAMPATDFMVRW